LRDAGSALSLSDRYKHALRLSCCYPFDERYTWALKRTGALACEITGLAPGQDQGLPLRPQVV
jgi:transcriptional regulator, GntR family